MHKSKERITYKKAGDGFLVYALCDNKGDVLNFAVKFDPTWRRNIDGLLPTYSAVLHLVDELRERFPGYKFGFIYADNLYSSIGLVEALLRRDIYYAGTLRRNRKPKDFELTKDDPVGTVKQIHKGDITIMLWRAKKGKEVRMITTINRPVKNVNIQRRKPAFDASKGHYAYQWVNMTVPDCTDNYNTYMNAVDIADQLRSYYTTRRRTFKWWHRFFFFVLDTALCNAHVCYKEYWERENERRANNNEEQFTPLRH